MFLTVEEAKKVWCPHARVTPEESSKNVSYNKIVSSGEKVKISKGAKCMATGCACWRWESSEPTEIDLTTGETHDRRGYCGLAGRPCS